MNGRTVRIERSQDTIIASSLSPSLLRGSRGSSRRALPAAGVRELEAVEEEDDAPRAGAGPRARPPPGSRCRPAPGAARWRRGTPLPRTSLKFETATALPSWRTSKSPAVRPWTGWPVRVRHDDVEVEEVQLDGRGGAGRRRRRLLRPRGIPAGGGLRGGGRGHSHVHRRHALCVPFGAVLRRIRRSGMISFASLFVGLVFGIVNVQLVAAAGVDRVELFLDGSRVAELRAPFRDAGRPRVRPRSARARRGRPRRPRDGSSTACGSGSTGRARRPRRASSWSPARRTGDASPG